MRALMGHYFAALVARRAARRLELLLVWGGILAAAWGARARRARYLVPGLGMSAVQVRSLVLSAAALLVEQPQ